MQRRFVLSASMAVLWMLAVFGCGLDQPSAPSAATPVRLNNASVIDALDYWASAVGITYTLLNANTLPRLFLRPGTIGVDIEAGAVGNGGIDGTTIGNQAISGLVLIERERAASCSPAASGCRAIFRHEVGHALGFLDEPATGLMSFHPDTDMLSPREIRMMTALYSIPFGATLAPDGRWAVQSTGASGHLDDLDAVQDILTYNVNTPVLSSHRTVGLTCRWQLPVPVYFDR